MAAWELQRLMSPDAGGPLKYVIAPGPVPSSPPQPFPFFFYSLHTYYTKGLYCGAPPGDLVTSAISVNSHHQTPSSV
ncbi:hypothetical protein HYQ44_006176 [Verticillium longisporum]|nr:hypothetical protein HYQ44_006176 [Verticillium longisporum]